MFRKALLILSGNAMVSLLLLARNLLVARLIPVEDYGIAVTFAVAMAVVEMMSALGLQQQIIQAKDGNDPRFQAGVQGFQVLRGVISAGVLFLCAGSIAAFLGVPEVAWAYQMIVLVPLMNAFQHFDIYRLNREMVFLPVILTNAVPALLSVLIVWPLAEWFGDYRVMLYAVIAHAAIMMVTSHIVARRPYRLLLDKELMGNSLKFGWPLLLNGMLLFAVFNGDKLIVGRELGMAPLAIFGMGITLTLTPTLVMAKSAQNFFLPQLSAIGDMTSPRFKQLAQVTVEASLVMGMIMVLAIAVVGQPIVYVLLGDKYLDLLPLLTWMAIMQGVRVFKSGGAIVAMAAGQNESAMLANLVRVLLLPVAWYVAVQTGDVMDIIFIAILGEIMGQFVAVGLLWWRTKLSMRPFILPHLGALICLTAVAIVAPYPGSNPAEVWVPNLRDTMIILAAFTIGVLMMRGLGRELRSRTAETKA